VSLQKLIACLKWILGHVMPGGRLSMIPARERERPFNYCDPCQGITPVLIKSPRDFFAAQAFLVVLALIVLLLVA
jgi:hypothetical protein